MSYFLLNVFQSIAIIIDFNGQIVSKTIRWSFPQADRHILLLFLLLCLNKILLACLILSLSYLKSAIFPRSHGSFFGTITFKTKMWAIGFLIVPGVSLILGTFIEKGFLIHEFIPITLIPVQYINFFLLYEVLICMFLFSLFKPFPPKYQYIYSFARFYCLQKIVL